MQKSICVLGALFSAAVLYGQAVVSPSPSVTGAGKGTDYGDYNVTDSFETGYRFSTISGDSSLYRSQANYRNGFSLLGNAFTMKSKDGHGTLFDSLIVTTQGLGSEPYSMANLRIEKNQRYQYDLTWRRSEYFNPFLINGGSGNLADTQRRMQDHDLTVSAARWINIRAGYSRDSEGGPAISSYELFIGGLARSVLPIDKDVHRQWNGYRLGADFDFAGFRLTLMRRWDYYKDDTRPASLLPGSPYPVSNPSVASFYQRSEPMHGRTPGWSGNLITNRKLWGLNARVVYSKGDQDFIYDEAAIGASVAGPAAKVSTVMVGSGLRPFLTGDVSLSFYPTSRVTITSNTSAMSNRIDGSGRIVQLSTAAAPQDLFWFSRLAEGRVSDSLNVNYRVTKWLAVNTGYQYTDRWVDSIQTRQGTRASAAFGALSNHLNAASFGFRLNPVKPLTVNLDGSLGRDNGAFTPIGLSHYHTVRGRSEYKLKNVRFTGVYRQLYNINAPVAFSYYKSHSRDISGTSSIRLKANWSLDVSYSKIHLDTIDALNVELPAANGTIVNVRGYDSRYISNVHSASAYFRLPLSARTLLYVGYALTHDAGDGRSVQDLGLKDPATAYLAKAQTFPLTYQAPLARLTVKLNGRLQWNAGWELYCYYQEFAYFGIQPQYRANTGYSSLSWSF